MMTSPTLEHFVLWFYNLSLDGESDPLSVAEGTAPQFNITLEKFDGLVDIFSPVRQKIEMALHEFTSRGLNIINLEHQVASTFTFLTTKMLNDAKTYLKTKCGIHLSRGFARHVPEPAVKKYDAANDMKVKVLMVAAVEANSGAYALDRMADQRHGKFNDPEEPWRERAATERQRARRLIDEAARLTGLDLNAITGAAA
jgi:hypothetical protein